MVWRSSLAHIIGVSVSETTAEMMIVTLRVMANSRNNRPTTSPMNRSGIKTAMSEMVRERMVKAICFDPLNAASSGESPFSMYRAMFSIITIASSTTKPVEIVSAINVRLFRLNPIRYMTPKVPTSDNGTAAAGMTVAGQGAEEQKDHHDHQRHSQHQLKLHVPDRRTNGDRAVGQYGDLDGRRQRTLQLWQQLLDAVHDVDDIGARLPLDVDDHRRNLVHPGRLLDVLHIVDHVGDIGQMHRRSVAIGDDQRLIFFARKQLIRRTDDGSPLRAVEGALRLIDVRCGHDDAQILQREPVGRQGSRIRLNPHSRPLPAADAHEPDAGQLRNLLSEPGFSEIFHLRQRQGVATSAPASGSARPPD